MPRTLSCLTAGPGGGYGCTVTTWAGSGPPGVGDDGPALKAVLREPMQLVVASDGALYIADRFNGRIRRVGPDGVVTTVAGIGTAEGQPLGDGLPATRAVLRLPSSLTFGPNGSMYVADTNNYAVRRVSSSGIISTVVGNFDSRHSGDGQPLSRVGFDTVSDVAVDADGTLFIAELNWIRRVAADGVVSSYGGDGSAASTPDGLLITGNPVHSVRSVGIDRDRRLLFFQELGSAGFQLRRVDLRSGLLSTLATGIQAPYFALESSGALHYLAQGAVWKIPPGGTPMEVGRLPASLIPTGIAASGTGDLYVSDSSAGRVYRLRPGGLWEVFAGGGTIVASGTHRLQATIFDSQGLVFSPAGDLYIGDFTNRVIRRIARDGIVTTVAGTGGFESSGDGRHPLKASFGPPMALTFDALGDLLFIDLNGSGGIVRGISPGADGVVDGSPDERIYTVAGRISLRDEADDGRADGGPARAAVLGVARGLCAGAGGELYLSESGGNRVRRILPGADGALDGSSDETIDTVAGTGARRSDGDGGPARLASVLEPQAIACAPDGDVYVAEIGGAIRRISAAAATITTVGRPGRVASLAIDGEAAVLYVPFRDRVTTQLFRLDPQTGQIQHIAGQSEAGLSGDGADAREARFISMRFFTVGPDGALYVVDNGNHRIRRIGVPDLRP